MRSDDILDALDELRALVQLANEYGKAVLEATEKALKIIGQPSSADSDPEPDPNA